MTIIRVSVNSTRLAEPTIEKQLGVLFTVEDDDEVVSFLIAQRTNKNTGDSGVFEVEAALSLNKQEAIELCKTLLHVLKMP